MNTEYPTLKPGDTIRCKNLKEAQVVGGNLVNNGFDYIIHGKTIHILEKGANYGTFTNNRKRDKE